MSNEHMFLFSSAQNLKSVSGVSFPNFYIFTEIWNDIVGTNFNHLVNLGFFFNNNHFIGEANNGEFINFVITNNRILSLGKSDRLYESELNIKPIAIFKEDVNLSQICQALHWKIPQDFIE